MVQRYCIFVTMSMLMWVPMLAFSLAVLIQVFYYLRYFRLLAFYREKQEFSAKEQAVSVIICARDEADEIERRLKSVQEALEDEPERDLLN